MADGLLNRQACPRLGSVLFRPPAPLPAGDRQRSTASRNLQLVLPSLTLAAIRWLNVAPAGRSGAAHWPV